MVKSCFNDAESKLFNYLRLFCKETLRRAIANGAMAKLCMIEVIHILVITLLFQSQINMLPKETMDY